MNERFDLDLSQRECEIGERAFLYDNGRLTESGNLSTFHISIPANCRTSTPFVILKVAVYDLLKRATMLFSSVLLSSLSA